MLRYFFEEVCDLPIIAAGSLLEFALDKYKTSLPVGRVEFMHLGPMSFQNTRSQGVPLSKGIDVASCKLLFLDVGLVNTGLKFDWMDIMNSSERELLHEGSLAEQFVGQHVVEWAPEYEQAELYFWVREGRSDAAELDCLCQKGKTIIAIEVKSGATGSMRSLHQWIDILLALKDENS